MAMFALAACSAKGGSGDDGVASLNGNQSASNQAQAADNKSDEDKMREFTKCMRDHGVNMPEPDAEGHIQMRAEVGPGDENKMKQADEACKPLLPNGGKPKPMSPEDLDKARATAKCMREHGVDMPDPDPNSPGMTISLGAEGDKDKVDKAMKECGMGAKMGSGPAVGGGK
jgi:hypothetical protein